MLFFTRKDQNIRILQTGKKFTINKFLYFIARNSLIFTIIFCSDFIIPDMFDIFVAPFLFGCSLTSFGSGFPHFAVLRGSSLHFVSGLLRRCYNP